MRLAVPAALCLAASAVACSAAPADPTLPEPAPQAGFTTSNSCRGCHPDQYQSWFASYHRTMTQAPRPETVLAPFDGRALEDPGRIVRPFTKDDGSYWIRFEDPAGARQPMEAQIALLTGSHHLQVYWMFDSNGRYVEMPWLWRIDAQTWIRVDESFLKPPDHPLPAVLWDAGCLTCHTVGGRARDEKSAVTQLGIACEACHGPAEAHAQAHRNPLHRYAQHFSDEADPTIVNPARILAERSSEVCGQCHALNQPVDVKTEHADGSTYRAGEPLSEHRPLVEFDPRPGAMKDYDRMAFWPDGTVRTAGRDHSSMITSKCYQGGELSCVSCHSIHGGPPEDQLDPERLGDESCLGCHEDFRGKAAEHSKHAAGQPGGRCMDCHMPYTTYGLFKGIRSHRIDSPKVVPATGGGRPNACNLCHLDHPLSWAAEQLGQTLELPEHERGVPAGLLWAFAGDAAQRAIATWHLARPETLAATRPGWQPQALEVLRRDPYAVVRTLAEEATSVLPERNEPLLEAGQVEALLQRRDRRPIWISE